MASFRDQYALVLFDLHGETSKVQTQKLQPQSRITVASRPYLHTSRNKYLVEILEISGNQTSLDLFHSRWKKTPRARAIEKEIQRRATSNPTDAAEGGYLDIDDQENIPNPAKKPRLQTKRTTKPNRPRAPLRMKQKTSKFPYSAEGSNGRKISILYEGSGDNSGTLAVPQRPPVFLDDLTPDAQDLVSLQVNNFKNNKISKGVQTDAVVIIQSDAEAEDYLRWKSSVLSLSSDSPKPPTPPPTQIDVPATPPPTKIDVPATPPSTKIVVPATPPPPTPPPTEIVVPATPPPPTPPSTSPEPVLMYPLSPRVIVNQSSQPTLLHQYQDIDQKLTMILEILKTKPPTSRPSIDCVASFLKDLGTPEADLVVQSVEEPPASPTETEDPSQTTITQFYVAAPVGETVTLPVRSVPRPDSTVARPLQSCFTGPIVEVETAEDLDSAPTTSDTELRVLLTIVWEIQSTSCSPGNFAWKLARRLFSTDQLKDKNYSGRKGKAALSPRRKHAIEHAIIDGYGPNQAHITEAIQAINVGIRNIGRQYSKKT